MAVSNSIASIRVIGHSFDNEMGAGGDKVKSQDEKGQ